MIGTRLIPATLKTDTDNLLPGCTAIQLKGISDTAALELWYALGVTGSPAKLLDTLNAFDNYPLLIKVLARVVALDRETPKDFDKWHENNPHFNINKLPLATVKQHVLAAAIDVLDETAQEVLNVLAAARTPVVYTTLVALLLVGPTKLCKSNKDLEKKLQELEDRELMGWDKKEDRYDLHPIVQATVLTKLDAREEKCQILNL